MDLHTVTEVISPAAPGMWRPGDAWLGGGTALFGEPRPRITRLLDLPSAGWPAITERAGGVEIAATCTIAELSGHFAGHLAGSELVQRCCHSFLASFKIWNVATVGGNLCAALPAGPMISLGAALDAVCTLLGADGGERRVPVAEFVTGEGATVLREGELLRSIFLPGPALAGRTAYRKGSLHVHGRSAALVIGRVEPAGGLTLTVTAATRRPWVFRFPPGPAAADVEAALATIPFDAYTDDVHGRPVWRKHLTRHYAEQIRTELSG
ncbi:CO/xanthine dehydrogenase FAD-binding subunit [Actinoplanes octamycinicus]|uniref:CO/xanthine dehydrogenase FAD-binding subunit n=1 Tax=Actinoplanes octamycinicus TaxID=135948 RepID=A0A7W7GYZ4_9ACTN|nr:FAD binding domain-containing protein [Actinoplanes octamycinicus]MBB4740864.1 CO/xanthine dehydrogenase FAD-binding subunit [Actinoplanes octamycinicus]GIE55770.1 FAD-binding molybdopterin dehydrogenase [Actinoplanes octamycinicus]